MAHHVDSVPSMQAPELSQSRYNVELLRSYRDDHEQMDCNASAAKQFQDAICALKLTSLKLVDVDFLSKDFRYFPPEFEFGSLAGLRCFLVWMKRRMTF